MKRKLINFEAFKKINEASLTKAETELYEAAEVLSRTLGTDNLELYCFDESSVIFETLDKSYIHANYKFDGRSILFENIEELVIDEESARNESRTIISKMVEDLIKNKVDSASQAFEQYITLPNVRRNLMEGKDMEFLAEKGDKKDKKEGKKKKAFGPMEKANGKKKKEDLKKRFGKGIKVSARFKPQEKPFKKAPPKKVNEWYNLTENVLNYLDYQEFGPAVNQSQVQADNKGNVVAVKMPNIQSRNEGKILSFNWKTLNSEVKVLRGKAWTVKEDVNFGRAMVDLRKFNNLSDDEALTETLEKIVKKWPDLLYLSQSELANVIGEALSRMGETSYDDNMCAFMAEGILRTASVAYESKINKILRIAGVEPCTECDSYKQFQEVVSEFYTNLDKNMQLEMQVFADLYNTLVEVHKLAHGEGNEILRSEANTYLKELKAVLERDAEPTLELAGEVATWLSDLVETNLETGDWNVSNTPYVTLNGDNPQMAKNASKGYSPSQDFSGDWGDVAPVSDGKTYKGKFADEMRNDAWGNWADNDTYPGLQNPYVPKPFGDYKMKEPSAADSGNDDWSRWQSGDTWPALQNPYVPKEAGGPGGTGYKMKSDNLVVDQ